MSTTISIPCPVWKTAQEAPKAPFFVSPGANRTYAEADAAVRGMVAGLRAQGVARGDCVAVQAPRGWRLACFLLACWRLGAPACVLSTRLPAEALAEQARRAGASQIVRPAEAPPIGLPTLPWPALMQDVPAEQAAPRWRLEAPAVIVFTSGSTAQPKPACLSLGNLVWSARGANANLPLTPGNRWLLSLPLYHVGGLGILMRCVLAGATVAQAASDTPLAEAIADHAITHVSLVPTQLQRLLQATPEDTPPTLQAVLLGGGTLPPAFVDEALDAGLPVHTTYGMTEMASQVTTTPPAAPRAQLRTAGPVLPHRALRIADDGEILVRGATLFQGYVTPHGLDRPLTADGWFATGDLGRLDAGGNLCVQGRKDNLIISGGENIQPEEVETALQRLAGVARAVVVGVPDATYGARPVAFVEVDPGVAFAPDAWHDALAAHLASFKRPDAYHPWPHGADTSLKVQRAALQEQAEALHGAAR
ncbi:MAG: o-succinylbenzoate--CoA ligase [Bacteroidetes bacterium]|jgi:O-succinylbenzoic acid--CoA ligase|nr:o-succinylbenzoate--CoA ligase [Bacteroidota bacterium]